MNKQTWRYGGATLVALAALAAVGGAVSAAIRRRSPTLPAAKAPAAPVHDGFDQRPANEIRAVALDPGRHAAG